MTSIEWVKNANGSQGKTWNPVVGCSILSPGCTNCYAMNMAARLEKIAAEAKSRGVTHHAHYDGTTKTVNGKPVWTGKLALAPDGILLEPLRRKKPTTYFVNSMGDLFHEDCPIEWIADVFGIMAVAGAVGTFHREADGCDIGPSWTTSDGREIPTKWPRMRSGPHVFQVLTKRAARMADTVNSTRFRRMVAQRAYHHARDKTPASQISDDIERDTAWPLPNVWLGVSTERQQEADERIPLLLSTPAAIRFISAEPLLGPIDLVALGALAPADKPMLQVGSPLCNDANCGRGGPHYPREFGCRWGREPKGLPGLDWVIAGGESGKGARPMHPEWARSLRDQCQAAAVKFFFKQHGEFKSETVPGTEVALAKLASNQRVAFGDGKTNHTLYTRVGKAKAGRSLDGVEYNEMPERA